MKFSTFSHNLCIFIAIQIEIKRRFSTSSMNRNGHINGNVNINLIVTEEYNCRCLYECVCLQQLCITMEANVLLMLHINLAIAWARDLRVWQQTFWHNIIYNFHCANVQIFKAEWVSYLLRWQFEGKLNNKQQTALLALSFTFPRFTEHSGSPCFQLNSNIGYFRNCQWYIIVVNHFNRVQLKVMICWGQSFNI